MDTMDAAQFRDHFGDALGRVGFGHERIVIKRRGRPVAALISTEDLALLEALEDRYDVEAAKAALAGGDFIPWHEVKTRLGL